MSGHTLRLRAGSQQPGPLLDSHVVFEHLSQTSLRNLLAKEGLVTYLSTAFVLGSAFADAVAQQHWSVSVIMAEHGKVFARERFDLKPYEATGK
jgi:hypothetical protein